MIASLRQRAFFVTGLIATAAAFLLPQLWLFSLSLKNKAGCSSTRRPGFPGMGRWRTTGSC